MRNDTDTEIINHGRTTGPCRRLNPLLPYYIATAVIAAVLIAMAIAIEAKEKKAGVIEAAYIARSEKEELIESAPVPLKRKHVIFRLGDDEIFRFTYEDGSGDMRYSFEVREGVL